MTWLFVAVAAGCGAVARYLVTAAALRMAGRRTIGTIAVNVTGSLVAGAIGAAATSALTPFEPWLGPAAGLVIAGGFLGSFTTMSTAMVEIAEGTSRRRVLRLVLEPALALAAASLGWLVVTSAL